MTVSEWHKIENDGDPWQPTCWLQMAHNDDDDDGAKHQPTGALLVLGVQSADDCINGNNSKNKKERNFC